MKILKYKILNELELPVNTTLLDVNVQDNTMVLWALVNTMEPNTELYSFQVIRTGRDITFNISEWVYLKTVETSVGIWHVWYKKQ